MNSSRSGAPVDVEVVECQKFLALHSDQYRTTETETPLHTEYP